MIEYMWENVRTQKSLESQSLTFFLSFFHPTVHRDYVERERMCYNKDVTKVKAAISICVCERESGIKDISHTHIHVGINMEVMLNTNIERERERIDLAWISEPLIPSTTLSSYEASFTWSSYYYVFVYIYIYTHTNTRISKSIISGSHTMYKVTL